MLHPNLAEPQYKACHFDALISTFCVSLPDFVLDCISATLAFLSKFGPSMPLLLVHLQNKLHP